jgi:hypothetical protein
MDLTSRDGTRQRDDKIRIVILRLPLPIPKILHRVTRRTQHPEQILFQFKATVVRGHSKEN